MLCKTKSLSVHIGKVTQSEMEVYMGNLLSGLEKIGLGKLSNMDLYEKEEVKKAEAKGEKQEVHVVTEEELIFDKTYKCPVCDADFKSKAVKTGKARLECSDSDLRPRYQTVDVLKYDAIVCPECGYAALSRFFKFVTNPQSKMIHEQISASFKGLNEKGPTLSYDEAIIRHQLALANTIVKKGKDSERAYTCLKLAWLCRGKAENLPKETPNREQEIKELKEQEDELIRNAYSGFITALGKEIFPICGMDEFTFLCLTAELGRKVKDYENAQKLISSVIVSKTASGKIKDRARTIRNAIKKDCGEKSE